MGRVGITELVLPFGAMRVFAWVLRGNTQRNEYPNDEDFKTYLRVREHLRWDRPGPFDLLRDETIYIGRQEQQLTTAAISVSGQCTHLDIFMRRGS